MGLSGGHYEIEQVGWLARTDRIVATKRVAEWLSNHGYDVRETLVEVLTSLNAHGSYTGSCALKNGETADEYLVLLPDDNWYLKFWVENDQLVVVWSCCWDGAVH